MAGFKFHSVLVTGANRGIGLEFVKHFLTNQKATSRIVIATCRSPDQASALKELQKSHNNLYIIKLDVNAFESFGHVAEEVEKIVGGKGLTLLVNNAGIYKSMADLKSLNVEDFMLVMRTNAAAPLFLTKAFHPLLKRSAEVNAAQINNGLSVLRAAVINISSCSGSTALAVSDRFRPSFGYWESKASLNMSTQLLAKQLQKEGILVESIHPGFVDTDMTDHKGTINTQASVTGMLEVILGLKEKNQTGFYDWKGDVLPF